MTLDEFLRTARMPQSSEIEHPDFEYLYVRRTRMPNLGEVIVIANIAAKRPGSGSFRRLLEGLSGRHVVVECVHNPMLRQHLLRHGWTEINDLSFHKSLFTKPE